ncbi:MAG: hypothetical protein JST96_03370 [Bacteroidetes bacterium]|nr:hypothetical protein [Bacteroidota bacterium]
MKVLWPDLSLLNSVKFSRKFFYAPGDKATIKHLCVAPAYRRQALVQLKFYSTLVYSQQGFMFLAKARSRNVAPLRLREKIVKLFT